MYFIVLRLFLALQFLKNLGLLRNLFSIILYFKPSPSPSPHFNLSYIFFILHPLTLISLKSSTTSSLHLFLGRSRFLAIFKLRSFHILVFCFLFLLRKSIWASCRSTNQQITVDTSKRALNLVQNPLI